MENSVIFLEAFVALLEEEKIYMDPTLTFNQVCYLMGTDECESACEVYRETGFSGDEILKIYRKSNWSAICRRYGIEMKNPIDNAVSFY